MKRKPMSTGKDYSNTGKSLRQGVFHEKEKIFHENGAFLPFSVFSLPPVAPEEKLCMIEKKFTLRGM